jgi:hypothetical protein
VEADEVCRERPRDVGALRCGNGAGGPGNVATREERERARELIERWWF